MPSSKNKELQVIIHPDDRGLVEGWQFENLIEEVLIELIWWDTEPDQEKKKALLSEVLFGVNSLTPENFSKFQNRLAAMSWEVLPRGEAKFTTPIVSVDWVEPDGEKLNFLM
jgi:hypothetical protein